MLLVMPYSTDVHDGRIRMGAVVIMGLCLVVHLIVQADNARINRTIAERIAQFESMERPEEIPGQPPPGMAPDLQALVEEFQTSQQALRDSVEQSLKEVAAGGLIHRLGVVPARFSLMTLVTYQFVHGGWVHLLGNLLFFYVCAVAMEKYWGLWRFVAAYLGCGVFAALTYLITTTLASPEARAMPLVGASGAIAGAMGAFMVTHSKVRVKLFYLALVKYGTVRIPSPAYFGMWFASQVASALLEPGDSSGIAYAAHVGGFVLGVVLGRVLKSEDDDALVVPARVMRAVERGAMPRVVSPSGPADLPAAESDRLAAAAPAPGDPATAPAGGGPSALLGAAREALAKNDMARATQCLGRAMEALMAQPAANRTGIGEAASLLAAGQRQFGFPPGQYYQWGKRLALSGLGSAALALLDTAAASADTPHLRKSSLLAAAEVRVRARIQVDRAVEELRTVVSMDGAGVFGQQAQRLLAGLSAPPRAP